MPSLIDRRLIAVGLQLVKSDRRPVGDWLQSNGNWSETCWRPFCDQNKILIKCYDMDEFISVQVDNKIIEQQIQLLRLHQNNQNSFFFVSFMLVIKWCQDVKTAFRCSWHCKLSTVYYLLETCRRSVAVSPVINRRSIVKQSPTERQ